MAAVQLAQRLGAEVLRHRGQPGEAGDCSQAAGRAPRVRLPLARLRRRACWRRPAGAGVDVVLNSLTGEFIAAQPRRAGHRRPVPRDRPARHLGRRPGRRPPGPTSTTTSSSSATSRSATRPPSRRCSASCCPLFAAGELRPLPRTRLRRRRRRRRLPVHGPGPPRRARSSCASESPIDRRCGPADGTYLVTGGLGGIGLLARPPPGRAGRPPPRPRRPPRDRREARRSIARSATSAPTWRTFARRRRSSATTSPACSTRSRAPCRRCGASSTPPASTTTPCSTQQTWAHFEHVLAPKVGGRLAPPRPDPRPRRSTCSCSSRRPRPSSAGPGRPTTPPPTPSSTRSPPPAHAESGAGLSISWGPWDRVGMTARLDVQDRARMSRRGFLPLTPERALGAFERAVAVERLERRSAPGGRRSRSREAQRRTARCWRRCARPHRPRPRAGPPGASGSAAVAGMRRAADHDVRRRPGHARCSGCRRPVSIEPRQPFQELGLDSLMAVELRNAVGAALGRPQPATLLFDHPTSDALVDHLLDAGRRPRPATATPASTVAAAPSPTPAPPTSTTSPTLSRGRGRGPAARRARPDGGGVVSAADTDALSPLKRAIVEIRELKARARRGRAARSTSRSRWSAWACASRAASHDAESFWQLLWDGVDAITEVPAERWSADDALRRRSRRARQDGHPLGRLPRRHRPVRRAVLRHLAARGREHGSAAAAAARGDVGGARARRHRRPTSLFGSNAGVFLGIANSDYMRLLLADREQIDTYTTTGQRAQRRRRPALVRPRCAGPGHVARHGVLVVARRRAPRRAGAAQPASATWRSPAAST